MNATTKQEKNCATLYTIHNITWFITKKIHCTNRFKTEDRQSRLPQNNAKWASVDPPKKHILQWHMLPQKVRQARERPFYTVTRWTKRAWRAPDLFAIRGATCGSHVATGNTKMKVVSHCIQTWARLRFPSSLVRCINPKNKMAHEYVSEVLGLEGFPLTERSISP